MADKYPCWCKKDVTATKSNRYRTHSDGNGEPCEFSSTDIPEHVLAAGPVDDKQAGIPVAGVDFQTCPQCDRKVQLTRLGYFEPHDTTLKGGERCEVSGVRAKHARRLEDVLLPGDEPASPSPKVRDSEATISPAPTSTSAPADSSPKELPPPSGTGDPEIDWSDVEGTSTPASAATTGTVPAASTAPIDWSKVGDLKHSPPESAPSADSSASTDSSSPESPTTSTPSPEPTEPSPSTEPSPISLGVSVNDLFLQPFSPFSQPSTWTESKPEFLQPTAYEGPVKGEPMGELAKELATRVKETFYAWSNRKSNDNRSAQTTLGPSEIGTPCDRRLAMSLMGVPAVNPGGDGWAAFVGTCTHEGMATIYTFADAGTGRYAVELPVFLGVPTVPRGTTDLLDRRDGLVVDWKVMGKYSLDKFKKEGPSATYRTQAHVYGLGAERGGEKVKNVAVVGLPRAGSSLDEMHIWTEKYDRKFAQAALDRVEKIAANVSPGDGIQEAKAFATGDDCRYCPFHLPKDAHMEKGCPGK